MLFAISDLHLSLAKHKPMDIFGDNWKEHTQKIKKNWLNTVTSQDVILIPGDVSWAMNIEEVMYDLYFIEGLPGEKVIIQGNHDFWWNSVNKLKERYSTINFLKNNYFSYEDYAICGTRGWLCPNNTLFSQHDEKIYNREKVRLQLSLELAKKNNINKIIVMLHYPPTNNKKDESVFTDIIQNYNVEKVIYGHLHGNESFDHSYKGVVNNTEYILVSADYINFAPILIKK